MYKKGFTLIEITVAITIIGILSGFVIMQMRGSEDAAQDLKKKSDIEILKNGIVGYRSDNYNSVPIANCTIGVDCPESFLSAITPYINSLPVPDDDSVYTYLSTDGSDCNVSAVLSDDSLYEYNCSSDEFTTLYPTGGVCGASNLETFSVAPEVGLCSSGVASTLNYSETDSAWSWNCVGENSGATASCLAYYESNYLACSIIPIADTCEVSEENQDDTSIQAASILNIYSLAGGHAELASQVNYPYKVCCEGTSLTNSCSGGEAVLNLSSVTNAHVEKNTQGYYANSACLSAILKTMTCSYASDCSTLGEDYFCVSSISPGDTNLHIGDCSAYATKVCCQMQPQ